MRLVIAGSRFMENVDLFLKAMDMCKFDFDSIIQGGARGVDRMAKLAAAALKIPSLEVPADWNDIDNLDERFIGIKPDGTQYNKAAGHIRNTEMSKIGDALFAIWDGRSSGTYDMITCMLQQSKPVQVIKYKLYGNDKFTLEELYDFEF